MQPSGSINIEARSQNVQKPARGVRSEFLLDAVLKTSASSFLPFIHFSLWCCFGDVKGNPQRDNHTRCPRSKLLGSPGNWKQEVVCLLAAVHGARRLLTSIQRAPGLPHTHVRLPHTPVISKRSSSSLELVQKASERKRRRSGAAE